MSEDITYCFDLCDNKECFRNRCHIGNKQVYSMAFLKDTEYCPLWLDIGSIRAKENDNV